jgi:hypothetical protein
MSKPLILVVASVVAGLTSGCRDAPAPRAAVAPQVTRPAAPLPAPPDSLPARPDWLK